MALGDIYTCVWGGRRGARRHLPAFGVAGVALGNIYLRLAWQAWLLFPLVARLVAVGFCWSPGARRHFAWQAWYLETSTFVSRGWRGTWRHLPAFGGHLATSTRVWRGRLRATLRGRRGTWLETSTFVSRGRRGAWRHLLAFAVAGVALGDIYLPLALQAWHLLHLVARLVAVGYLGRRATLRGRHSTWRHLPSFRVAGVALRDRQQICVAVTIVENPGSVEGQTKDSDVFVCNAIVQQGATRVRCSFWHEQVEELAAQPPGTSLMLYQVLISKRKDGQLARQAMCLGYMILHRCWLLPLS